jgi:hypothetical protein
MAPLLVLFACSAPLPPASPSPAVTEQADEAIVYLIERDWHTDVGLAVEDMTGPLATLERAYPGVRFLTFGFGERQFVLNRDITVFDMALALLPSESAVLMTALGATPEDAFGATHVVRLHVSRSGLARIHDRIWDELEKSRTGEPIRLADGPYPGSEFLAARTTYSLANTCNTWTAMVLRTGGLPMTTAGVLFVDQVMLIARRISRQQMSARDG